MKKCECPGSEALPPVLFYWRTKTAESSDERARSEVASFVAGISATMPEWRSAIRGDPAAAVGLVVRRRIPEHIGVRDLSMTVLLAHAFFGPVAALVLSHMLAGMPIEARERPCLSASSVDASDRQHPSARAADAGPTARRRGPAACGRRAVPAARPFELWRSIPAERFDLSRRFAVAAYLATCAGADVEWRRAIAGDATCALRMEVPDEITYNVDARMTLLLYCALDGGGEAALVLARLLRRMPIGEPLKERLATSWLVDKLSSARSASAASSRRHAGVPARRRAFGGMEDRS